MSHLRAWLRWPVFVALTGIAAVVQLLGVIVLAPFPGPRLRWQARVLRHWSRAALWVIGVRTEVSGAPPRPPFFLVSNHLSYIDVAVIASHLDCVFVAKSEVARWPVIGWLCSLTGTLYVDRGNKRQLPTVIERIQRALRCRVGVVVFPEGTSSAGHTVLRFRPALLEAAARAELAVSYASVSYRTPPGDRPARTAVCWWGGAGFVEHLLGLFRVSRVQATLDFGAERVRESDRKRLAERLWHAVSGQLRPVAAEETAERVG